MSLPSGDDMVWVTAVAGIKNNTANNENILFSIILYSRDGKPLDLLRSLLIQR